MTSLMDLEPYLDNCIELLLTRIHETTEGGEKPLNTGIWLQYFAYDVLGEINFSQQLGFLKTGTDVGSSIAAIDGLLQYLSIIGQMPWLHRFLLGNPLMHKLIPQLESSNEIQNVSLLPLSVVFFAVTDYNAAIKFALKMIKERQGGPVNAHRDILAHFLEVHHKDPTAFTFREILGLTTTNLYVLKILFCSEYAD